VTAVQVRVARDQADDADADLVLDIYGPQAAGANVQWDSRHASLLKGLTPGAAAMDLLRLAMAVYCIDKLLVRAEAEDAWSRAIELRLPVQCLERFRAQSETLRRALNFLSGDRWTLHFTAHPVDPPPRPDTLVAPEVDAVSLFSGGLDSLSGAIDQLANGDRIVGVAHFDAGITPHRQSDLWNTLAARYPDGAVALRRLVLRPQARPQGLDHAVPKGEREPTTRTRSLLFIAAAIAVADALDDQMPVVMPENGFVGINVPLIASRQGALSTRTTHPRFLGLVGEVLEGLALCHELRNPYRLRTKGEILAGSADADLLRKLAPTSLSCSHPEAPRHRTGREGNCGYCWPCLIRRASTHHVGWDPTEDYIFDALGDVELLDPSSQSGASLRAAVASLHDEPTAFSVLRNGGVPAAEVEAFFDLHLRGRAELRTWLEHGAGHTLRTWLP
jgi:7-cyano-7-deazaguanine synthase in queuosine biosynthesis